MRKSSAYKIVVNDIIYEVVIEFLPETEPDIYTYNKYTDCIFYLYENELISKNTVNSSGYLSTTLFVNDRKHLHNPPSTEQLKEVFRQYKIDKI